MHLDKTLQWDSECFITFLFAPISYLQVAQPLWLSKFNRVETDQKTVSLKTLKLLARLTQLPPFFSPQFRMSKCVHTWCRNRSSATAAGHPADPTTELIGSLLPEAMSSYRPLEDRWEETIPDDSATLILWITKANATLPPLKQFRAVWLLCLL